MRSSPLRLPSIEARPGAAGRLRCATAGAANRLRRAAAGAACAWLLVLAVACGACDAVLGLGQYTLACDAGNGGCGGSGGGGAGDAPAAR